ncbi:hypothetical protein C5167_007468 [Papaver somniferum]|nr:hypothetical protein C5167_007468 [Papaver somniferum]
MGVDISDVALMDHTFGKLPDHLLIEIFIRVPVSQWVHIACVKQNWAHLFRGECLWKCVLLKTWPSVDQGDQWAGPIGRGSSKRRYEALYVSKHVSVFDGEIDEIMGHTYLFLKEQLELSVMPPASGILHGTIIDQFIACGKSRDKAMSSLPKSGLQLLTVWMKVFLPYPYSRSYKVQWRVFEKLLTDFRDCFDGMDYYDILACAKLRFQPIPSAWLGY